MTFTGRDSGPVLNSEVATLERVVHKIGNSGVRGQAEDEASRDRGAVALD